MSKTVLNVKIDEELKKQAQATARDMNLPISQVIAVYLKDFVNARTITISAEPKFRPGIEKELVKLRREALEGKNLSPRFSDLDEGFKWLDS